MKTTYQCLIAAACLACGATPTPPPAAQPPAAPPQTASLAAPSSAPAAPAPPSEGQPSLSTFFEARIAGGKTRPLVSGDALRSGDRFWIELLAREKLLVWVLYASPDGSAQVIYPTTGEVVLTPGRLQRVPETQDFELDDKVGWERLLIVASRERLDTSASQLAKLVEHVRKTHQWPSDTLAVSTPEARPEKKVRTAAGNESSQRDAIGPSPRPSENVYGGPTPVLEPRVASADLRGLTRGIKLADSKAGRLDFQPDTEGVIAIPLLLRHEP